MTACESLATKAELAELNAKIDGLNAKIDGFLAQLNQKADQQEVEAVKVELAKKADTTWVQAALNQVKEWAQNALDALKAAMEAAISGVRNWAEAALDALRNLIESLFNRDDIEKLWAALSGKVDKNQGIGINGSYENGGINLTVTANQIGSDTSYVNLFIPDMGDYVTKPEFENHKNLPIPDAHDYDNNIDLSQYVKKGSGMGIGGSYVNGGINLTITSELGTDNETINLFLGDYVTKPEFENHKNLPIPDAHDYDIDLSQYVKKGSGMGIGGSYVNGGINLTITSELGTDNETINLFLDSYASKSDLDKKVDKNKGIGISGTYENGGIRLTVFADQIGNDSEFIPLFIGGEGGGGVPWSDFMAHLNDPTAHNLGQSGFEAFWDGAGIGFVVTIAGQSFSDDVRIYPEVDLELIERTTGDELKVKVTIGSESSVESVFLMGNAKIDKIYQILGGDRWFPQSGQSPRFKPDEEIRAKCSGHYDGDSNMQATGLPTADLIELIWASQAPNYQKLGLKDFPGEVPFSLIRTETGEQPRTIANQLELNLWLVKQIDALIGEFPIKIKIQDTDLTQEGDQTRELAIGNLAEGISELFGLAFSEASVGDANLNILMRLIPEILRIRQLSVTTQDICIANRDFLGYEEREIVEQIESNFSALKKLDNIARLLEPETQKYKTIEFAGKDTLMAFLTRLQFVASLQKAALMKTQEDFEDFIYKAENQENNDNWEDFVATINDPTSQFNVGERVSRIRDINA